MSNTAEQAGTDFGQRRKGWVAILLSMLLTGLGQLYNGQLRKAVIYLLFSNLAPLLLALSAGHFFSLPLIGALLALQGLIQLVATIDAWLSARRIGDNFRSAWFNRVPIYLASYLLFGVMLSGVFSYYLRTQVVEAFDIPSSSMEPTLLIGDQILVDKAVSDFARGDLIVFEFPPEVGKVDPRDFIKRIVGLPGEVIEIRNKQLLINGQPRTEPYVVHSDSETIPPQAGPRDFFGPVTVPAESYFVLGDNRDRSFDSRFWGFVGKSRIQGRAEIIYWSWDQRTFAIRRERIGEIPVAGTAAN